MESFNNTLFFISTFLFVFSAKHEHYYFSADSRLRIFLCAFLDYRMTFLFSNVAGAWIVLQYCNVGANLQELDLDMT